MKDCYTLPYLKGANRFTIIAFPDSSYGTTKIAVICEVANPLITFTLHLVGEVQLATADGGWTSREILEAAKVKKLLTSKAGSKIIDKEGASSLLSAASDMAWRNT